MNSYFDFIVMPYSYVLFASILPRFKNVIEDSVLIFDEAHNVPQAACEGRSYEFTSGDV